MRTTAWEAAFQIALRNCSKEVAGAVCVGGQGRGTCIRHTLCRREPIVTRSRCYHERF